MRTEQWSKEESILVLNLYMTKPIGLKAADSDPVVNLAQLLGRTPEALCRRMQWFRQWYPVLPFDADENIYTDENPAIWSDYFNRPQKARREAPAILKEFCIGTLTLNLYFQLIISTMNEKVPEVIALAKLVKRPIKTVVSLLHDYASLDPFLKGNQPEPRPVSPVTRLLWERYADDMDKLSRVAKYIENSYSAGG